MSRPVPRSGWLSGVLIALMLFAQHGALTHALSHAARLAHGGYVQVGASAHQPAGDAGHSGGRATKPCAIDFAYSQVLGGVATATAEMAAAAGITEHCTPHPRARIVAASPPFLAQGPPVFL